MTERTVLTPAEVAERWAVSESVVAAMTRDFAKSASLVPHTGFGTGHARTPFYTLTEHD